MGDGHPKRAGYSSTKVDASRDTDESNRDQEDVWGLGHTPSVMTPPGAINELPGFGISSPAVLPRLGDAPWSGARKRIGDYDWANFVYAYARGRWDPVRSPHPPGHSNIMPGAVTQIGTHTESIPRLPTPEAPEETATSRRPSLTYILPPEGVTADASGTNGNGDKLPYGVARAQTPPPTTTSSNPVADHRDRAKSSTISDQPLHLLQSVSHPGTPSQKTNMEPKFIDPFSLLQLASNSAPNVGQALSLADGANRLMSESHRGPGPTGAKTDSEVATRANSSRHGTDNSKKQDDSVWQGTSYVSPTDRHAGVFPYVSLPERPGLDSRISELVLSSAKPVVSSKAEKDSDKEVVHRPLPTPVQHVGLTTHAEADEGMRSDTWSSAPETSASLLTPGVTSFAHMATNTELGTVAGLRRAARRTSMKKSEGSRDFSRDALQASHSKSYPMVPSSSESSRRDLPPLDQIQSKSSEDVRNLDQKEGGSRRGFLHEQLSSEALSQTVSERWNAKMPANLSQIGQTLSHPSLPTYVNVGKRVETFYRDHGYLPAIVPPDEQNRRQAMRRYGPPKLKGDINFDRIAHLVKLVFNTKLVLISLVGEKTQFFQTEVGAKASGFTSDWLQQVAQDRDCSLCSHAILQTSDEALVVLDTERDWRFAGNPLVRGPPNIRFYAGSPLRTADGYNLGSLCIIDDRPWQEFNARQRHTLKEFSRVVMREMELARDTIHLRIRDRMQHSIETFTRECLEMESSEAEEREEENSGLHQVYDFAAKGMREALNASGAIIFDLSHFELVVSSPQTHEEDGGSKIFFPSPYQYPEITPFADFEHPETIEGVTASAESDHTFHKGARLEDKSVPPMSVLGSCELHPAPEDRDRPVPLSHYLKVAEFLRKYRAGHYFPFTPTPFRHLLPARMTNVLMVPIFGLNKQPFALLCAYSEPMEESTTLEDIKEPGLQYLRAMGTIILSAILKKDIMLADKAKSHFISKCVVHWARRDRS